MDRTATRTSTKVGKKNKHAHRHKQQKALREVHTKAYVHAPEHKHKETVTLLITLNLRDVEESDKRSCHIQRGAGGYPDPRLLLVSLFSLSILSVQVTFNRLLLCATAWTRISLRDFLVQHAYHGYMEGLACG